MLYSEIIAVCSQIHTKDTNTLCGQNVELLNVKLAVHIVHFTEPLKTSHEASAISSPFFPVSLFTTHRDILPTFWLQVSRCPVLAFDVPLAGNLRK